jgi:hypothetical protein
LSLEVVELLGLQHLPLAIQIAEIHASRSQQGVRDLQSLPYAGPLLLLRILGPPHGDLEVLEVGPVSIRKLGRQRHEVTPFESLGIVDHLP